MFENCVEFAVIEGKRLKISSICIIEGLSLLAPCKVIQDGLYATCTFLLGITAMLTQNFGGQIRCIMGDVYVAYVLESTLWISDSRYWIPDSFSRWNLDSGFLRPGFRIPQAKISCFSESDIKILWIPESEYPHMGDSTYPASVFSIKRNCSLFLWVPLLSRNSFTAWWFVKKIAENSIRSNNKQEKSNEGGA